MTPEVRKALGDSGQPFPLHGLVLRSTLLHMLRARLGLIDPGLAPAETFSGAAAGSSSSNGGVGASGSGGGSSDAALEAAAEAAARAPSAAHHVPPSQAERLRALEQMEQIPLKVRAGRAQGWGHFCWLAWRRWRLAGGTFAIWPMANPR